ncbi:hypothetical protein PG996_010532 [Apiospora saccharicola]|uniref:Uncharacterized protein n=1 Tax=Apiospora saccharicola TaxID=335842 RepID=A0ABR1UNV4_9PEZI
MEGGHANPHASDHVALDHEHEQHHEGGVQFNESSFGNGNGNAEHNPVAQHPEAVQHDVGMQRHERKSSKDYSHTDEWGKLSLSLSVSSLRFPVCFFLWHICGPIREAEEVRPKSLTQSHLDASKTIPSRFQQRKGSIFATPSSRDGHVDRNLEKDAEFHKKHSKRFSFSKVKDKAADMVGSGEGSDSRRRRSSAGHSSS